MTLILCCCWFNIEHNNFHAAHNDLMVATITESNLMVDDSDELSSKIFTTFPSFQESHSLLNCSQSREDLWRTVILLINRKQISEICSHSWLWSSEQDPREGLFMCVLILNSADPAENETSHEFLRDFIVFMVCIMSTRPPPPPSKQQDKIHLMACQEVRVFYSFVRLSCRLLSLSNNQTCLCTMLSCRPQQGTDRRDMSGTGELLRFAFSDSASPSAGVHCSPPTVKDESS